MKDEKWKKIALLLSIVFLSALPFISSLTNDFVAYDDASLVYENPFVRNFDIKGAFLNSATEDYIPLVTSSFAIEHKFFGFKAFYFHLNNLILHLLNVGLVFILVLLLVPERLLIAGIVALLFGIHPLHVESVAWVSQRKDVLCTLFSLLSLIFFYKSDPDKNSRSLNIQLYTLSVLMFVLAMFSKFMAVSLPAVVVLIALYKNNRKNLLLKSLPYFLITAVFTYIHLKLHNAKIAGPDEGFQLLEGLKNGLDSLAFYLTKTLVPTHLAVHYDNDSSPFTGVEYVFLIFWAGLFAALMKFYTQYRRLLIFSGSFFLVSIFPVLQIIPFGNNFVFADRFMYFPSIGVFIPLALLASELLHSKSKALKAGTGFSVIAVTILFTYLSSQQVQTWKNTESLWNNVIAHYPKNAVAYNNLGVEAYRKGKISEAKTFYTQALDLNSKYSEPRISLAAMYMNMNQYEPARAELKKALEYSPYNPTAHFNLGVIAQKESNFQTAVENYKNALSASSTFTPAYINLASAYIQLGQLQSAIDTLKAVLKLNASLPEAHNNLGAILFKNENVSEAMEEFKMAIELAPNYEQAHLNLAMAYAKMGNQELATAEINKVLELQKQNATEQSPPDQ